MKRIIILLSVLLLLPVWTQAEIKQPGDTTLSKGLTPYVPAIATDHAPKVRKLANQLLALIDSMHTEENFSVQSIQKNSGIKLIEYEDRPNKAYFGEKLTNTWGYTISRSLDIIDEQPIINIRLFSNRSYETQTADFSDICLDMGRFHQTLLKMGYRHSGNDRGGNPGIQYRRDRVNLDFSYIGKSNERIGHDCIIAFSIYIDKPTVQP